MDESDIPRQKYTGASNGCTGRSELCSCCEEVDIRILLLCSKLKKSKLSRLPFHSL